MTLYETLKSDCQPEWRRYVDHAFVRQLGAGTLPTAAFRHYLVQDYLFLIQFARAYALLAYKSPNIALMRKASRTLVTILDETPLHLSYCAGWGLSEADVMAAAEAPANFHYTRYVLDIGQSGDALELMAALLPCVVGYAEIGAALRADPMTKREGNLYLEWIETYGGERYQQSAQDSLSDFEDLGQQLGASARIPRLGRIFKRATELERDFWQMGLDQAGG